MTQLPHKTTVLISGAGIAGPILAYWLRRLGFSPTVVEQASAMRAGGHPVDLWGAAVDVVERMGILPAIEAARTRNDVGVMITRNQSAVEIDLTRLTVEIAERHVEIMRGDLVSILYEGTRNTVEYIFGDTITALEENAGGVRVSFARGASRDFMLVIGADGQHSNVRRLVFGEEQRFRHYIGGYVCGYTIPNDLQLVGRIHRYVAPEKTAFIFPIRQSNELGVGFLFRRAKPVDLHHDDVEGQKRLLRDVFAGEGWEIPRLLGHLTDARDFYFDSITQIHMESWSRSRIALVGDAGYAPAPAVGGGTTLAAVAAYILAGELAKAAGDHARSFRNYESALRNAVLQSRNIGPAAMKTLIPASHLEIWISMKLAPILQRLPDPIRRRFPLLPREAVQGLQTISTIRLNDYELP
jgi:2-polyprenyl-6-methoxyphenol hydroxylase-like FAD-dependent oxidoreductase